MKVKFRRDNPKELHVFGIRTFFAEKILAGTYGSSDALPQSVMDMEGIDLEIVDVAQPMVSAIINPKTSIKKGTEIEMVTTDGNGNEIQFAPAMKVTKKSKIKFVYNKGNNADEALEVFVSGNLIGSIRGLGGEVVHADPDVRKLAMDTGETNLRLFLRTFASSKTYDLIEWKPANPGE